MTTTATSTAQEDSSQEENDTDGVEFPRWLSAVVRLLLPVILMILSLNYINVTWGRIQWSNLRYPYFIIAVMNLCSIWIIGDELYSIYQRDKSRATDEAVQEFIAKWRTSIFFAIISIIYVFLVPVTGFFSASVFAMASIMYTSGVRSLPIGGIVIFGLLGFIWATFVQFIGVNPPSGLIDSVVFELI